MWLDFGKPTEVSHWAYSILLAPANAYTHTLHIRTAIIRLGWLVCFSRVTFADPVNSWLGQWDPWRALHGRHGCEIHPRDGGMSITPFKDGETPITPFKRVWAYDWLFWDSWLDQTVLTDGLARLRFPIYPLHPPLPPATRPPPITCHQWYYSVFEKSCWKSSSVS